MSAEPLDLFASAAAASAPPGAYAPPAPATDDVPRFDPTSETPLPTGVTMLEASAGTGKTYSIASIVLRLVVEEGLGIDELLVVTFTEAATAELRDRVRRRLRDALAIAERAAAAGGIPAGGTLAAHDEVARVLVTRALARGTLADVVARLRGALGRFDDAPITTIHGFCHRVLRERAFECGGELDAELLTDDAELLESVVRDFWACETAKRPVALVEALVGRAGVSLPTLHALARRALRHPESCCVPALDLMDATSLEVLLEERARLAEDVGGWWGPDGEANEILALVGEAREAKILSGSKWPARSVENRAIAIATWARGNPARDPLPEKELRYFGASGLRAACNKGKEAQAPVHPLCARIDALLDADARVQGAALAEALRLQHACVAWVRAEVARRKRAARQHGFDDLLRLVRDALKRDEEGTLADALRQSFRAALIDEFQDTDDVQWEIFRRAFGTPEHRLVLIGDPKQSIYAFRGADVEAYLAARGSAATRWALDANWRTDGALVDALHALWGAHPAPFAEPAIAWRGVRARHGARRLQGAGAPLRIRFLAREGELAPKGTSPLITKERLAPRLPALVASDVARFLGGGATITERVGGQERARPVRPADVAVLVRSHRQAREVQAALRRAGVPAVIHGAESVFASREALELVAVLAAVLEPASPSLARAALATDLLGIAAAAELSGDGAPLGPGDLLAALDADDARWDVWAERLRAWRGAWRGEGAMRAGAPGVMRLVRALCDDLALPARLLALVDGERRLTNVLHLAELLHAASTERALAPGATLAWLREQVANAESGRDDAARQLRLESDDEAAQVVTVHSSKGLEYGAVWCPYLWDGTLSHPNDLAFPHVPVAGAPTPHAIDLRGGRNTPAAALVDDARFAESLRLAYVAMTRARHQVTLWWGAATSFDSSPLAWLLHGDDVVPGDAGQSPRSALADLQLRGRDDDALRDRLEALEATAPGLIAVEDEDVAAPPARWRAPDAARPPLAVRAWTRTAPLDDGWRLGSFTALTRGAHAHRDADDDAEAPEALDDARRSAPDDEGDVPLAAFPASAQAGLFFHEVLERHDPAAPDALRALVDDRLHAYGFDAARWTEPVTDALRGVLDAPLDGGTGADALRLRDVPLSARLTELRFELPACGDGDAAISPAALARAFRDHPGGALAGDALAHYADRVAALGFRPLRGFLTGAIDLVARHAGRWWLLDYKSNRLGARRADYGADRMAREMEEAHYVLQYHLYAVALHRWLTLRVPGYDWDRDVGGACYVFLRGVGDGTGVFVDRPPRARIEALDRVLREGAS
jgi:exodeoxyribonuclease V beta subunit